MYLSREPFLQHIQSLSGRAISLEIWVIPSLVLAGMVSTRLLPAAAFAALIFWLIRWLACGHLSCRTTADWAIALLMCTLPVTLWATSLPEITLMQVYRLLSGIALYYALANWATTPARLRRLVAGISLSGLGLALLAPIAVDTAVPAPIIPAALYGRFSTLFSDTIHPNVLAGSLVILLPAPLAILLFAGRRAGRSSLLLNGSAVLLMTVALVLTRSRGAWVAGAAALAVLCVLRWRAGWIVLALLGAAAGLGIYRLGFTPFLDLLSSSGASTLEARLEAWSRAVTMIRDFPFTGIGMGSFSQVAAELYPFVAIPPETVPHAHNLFLQVAVDLGLPGLIAWLSVWMLATASSWALFKYGRSSGEAWSAGLGAGLLASQAALTVHGLTDAVTWGMVRPAPLVWGLWGLAFAGWMVATRARGMHQEPRLGLAGAESGYE